MVNNKNYKSLTSLLILFILMLMSATKIAYAADPGGWEELPNTTLNAQCPEDGLNGATFGTLGGEPLIYDFSFFCLNVTEAWSGASFDTTRNRLYIWGGGHMNYLGNEIYALDLNNTPSMVRLTDPATPLDFDSDPSELPPFDGTQPRSRETYDGMVYLPGPDKLWAWSGSLATQGFPDGVTWLFDPTNNTWERQTPSGDIPVENIGAISAYDPNTGAVYLHNLQNLYRYTYNTSGGTYTQLTMFEPGYYVHMTGVIDPKRNKFILIGRGANGEGQSVMYDISAGSDFQSEEINAVGDTQFLGVEAPGLAYDPVIEKVVAWAGGDTVYILDLDATPPTWTAESYPVQPPKATEAPVAHTQGTYGRFEYAPAMKAFVLYNATNKNGYLFRWPDTDNDANQSPAVDAGPDQTITLPSDAILDGTVDDDGEPNPPGAVTTLWTVVSGPGTVTFSDDTQVDTSASFSEAGTYVLDLTVDDSDLTANDQITITVNTTTEPSDLLGYWTLDDGSGGVASDASGNGNDGVVNGAAWTVNGMLNGALEFDGINDSVDIGTLDVSGDSMTISAWIKADTLTHLRRRDARIVSKATGTATQAHYWMLSTIKLGSETALRYRLKTNASTKTLIATSALTTNTWIHVAAVYDGSQMRLYQDGAQVGSTSKTGTIDQNAAVSAWIGRNPGGKRPFDGLIDDVQIHSRALSASEIADLASDSGNGNQSPMVDAGTDQAITLPNDAILDGTVDDDGEPNPPGAVTTLWTVVSGPGTVTFGNDTQVDTTARFSEAGTYVLDLAANDSDLVTNDSITVTVNTAGSDNIEPTVNAGSDQTITLPNDAILDGTVNDDGEPNPPGAVTTLWTIVSGTGTVTFGNDTQVDTTASFSEAGTYVLDLAANDSDLTANDQITITVNTTTEPSDLLGYWTLDDGSGGVASDSSGNGNDGVVNGAAWTVNGMLNGALEFDGINDSIDIGTLDVSGDSMTISAWIKADTLTHLRRRDARIVSKATGTATQAHYWMLSTIKLGSETALRYRLKTNASTKTLIATSALTTNTWIHVAAVYDGSQMRLYQDGVQVGSTSKTGTIDQNAAVSAWIGRNPGGKRPFDGLIDDVQIHSRALSASEIADLANP